MLIVWSWTSFVSVNIRWKEYILVFPWFCPLVHWGRFGVIAHSRVVLLFEIFMRWGLMNYGVVLALGREGSAQSEVISSRWILGLRTVAILPWDGLNTVILSYVNQHQHIPTFALLFYVISTLYAVLRCKGVNHGNMNNIKFT